MKTNLKALKFLDNKWCSRIVKYGAFQVHEYLDGDRHFRAIQKKKFFNGKIINPVLDYPRITSQQLSKNETGLLALKKDILRYETNAIVRSAYQAKIAEKLAKLSILRATASGDMVSFKKYSELVYGKPSLAMWICAIYSLKQQLQEAAASYTSAMAIAARELDHLLPKKIPVSRALSLPTKKEIDLVHQQTLKEFGGLLKVHKIVPNRQYNHVKISAIFKTALRVWRCIDWRVVIARSSKNSISVDQERKIINIPAFRQLTGDKLRVLLVHEIGTHVARRVHGEKSSLKLLGLGLDHCEKGEEGIAMMREQVLSGGFTGFAGEKYLLAIGLVYGLDGCTRDFRGVYEFLEKYYSYQEMKSNKKSRLGAPLAQTAPERAWDTAVRLFRGTDCATAGTCFTKDLIYRQGNLEVWRVVRKNPAEVNRFNMGRYDPANKEHLRILRAITL